MPLTFTFPQLAKSTDGAAAITEDSLKTVGFEFSSNNLPDDYLFSRMGGWNVTFRASICRVRNHSRRMLALL